jgi:hypothetical protein
MGTDSSARVSAASSAGVELNCSGSACDAMSWRRVARRLATIDTVMTVATTPRLSQVGIL